MKKHRNKIVVGVIVIAVLAVSLFWGGFGGDGGTREDPERVAEDGGAGRVNEDAGTSGVVDALNDAGAVLDTPEAAGVSDGGSGTKVAVSDDDDKQTAANPDADASGMADSDMSEQTDVQEVLPPENPQGVQAQTSESSGQTQAPEIPSEPVEGVAEQNGGGSEGEMTVTLVISCATILDNMDKLKEGKAPLIPSDGVLFSGTVVFYEDESVFNVLLREVRKNRIHMEFVNTPIYNSAYIEGIGNIYEFDCGERSGWMYSVNGLFPNYGCSRCELRDGDAIMWLFTCDRGADIGGGDAADSYGFG